MKKTLVLLSLFFSSTLSQANAQSQDFTQYTTNLIRLCAPSETIRAKFQGSVGGFIAKKLAGAEANGEAEVFRDGELLEKLIEASPNDATEIYKLYLNCIKPKLNEFVEAEITKGPKDIQSGGTFSAQYGTSVSLLSGKYFFSITGARLGSDKKSVWKVKTTTTGGGRTLYSQLEIGERAKLKGTDCGVILNGIDNQSYTYRFTLQC